MEEKDINAICASFDSLRHELSRIALVIDPIAAHLESVDMSLFVIKQAAERFAEALHDIQTTDEFHIRIKTVP